MKTRFNLSPIVLAALAACSSPVDPEPPAGGFADTVFLGTNIITMDTNRPTAEAVAIRGDSIALVGDREQAMALAGPGTRIEELGDKALIPGLIDTHGHFGFTARLLKLANLSPPPVGPVNTIDDIVELLRAYIAENEVPTGAWVIGYGYDDSLLEERRHPTRADLDRISTDHPIGILHVSGHLATTNSAALTGLNINADSGDPPGGIIRRQSGSREPNGVLEETAAFAVFGQMAAGNPEDVESQVREAAIYYASFGITTAQEASTSPNEIAFFKSIAAKKALPIDIAAYPVINQYPLDAIDALQMEPAYSGGYRVAGVKFSLDGSPQGRTAWLTKPYLQGPEGADANYVAYPTIDPDTYKAAAAVSIKNGVPILAHANGDAAIDLMIDGIDAALKQHAASDHRAVIIHAQLMREDQLDRAKELGVVPSFFSAHPFFWGDWHRESFGDERALNISPIRWAVDRGVPFTIHNDAPIVPPDMMRLWWATVNRNTRSGFVLGADQRASVYEALNAMTLTAAWQYFEEDRKGSITAGKQADLVVLDRDPMSADPDTIKDIKVLETIARGHTVFELPNAGSSDE
ncbi:MAG: amidohydrolase [Gammaproteobacteria bacterium]|nr:amidohydrolase [Gammaproteobacteria bacterium]